MARILIVEDEKDLREVLDYNLKQAGHEVLSAGGGAAGLKLARDKRPALVLLDLMLPDIAGTEICRAIKTDPALRGIAVVMLTAKGEESDRVAGFELGADDYIAKPFSLRELTLRIQAVLRRGAGETGRPSSVEFGALRLDRDAHRAWVGGGEVPLTAIEFKLLLALYDARNRVLSRSALLDGVWGLPGDINTRTVDTHVKRLREKLGAAGDYIETVRGVGYRFADRPAGTPGAP